MNIANRLEKSTSDADQIGITSGVSIAMCTFNGERHLGQQLASFAEQTLQPAELIVCDDGSSDGTLGLIKRFSESAKFPVRLYVNETNLGSTKNFEKAIGLCSAPYIALADQDDVWKPEKLERLISSLTSRTNACGAFSNAAIVDAQRRDLGYTLWDAINFPVTSVRTFVEESAIKVLSSHNIVTGATLVIKRSCLQGLPPIPRNSVHDAWLAWALTIKGGLIPVPDCLIEYRQHQGNQIGARRRSLKEELGLGRPKSQRSAYTGLAEEAEAAAELMDDTPHSKQADIALLKSRALHYRRRAQEMGFIRRCVNVCRELVSGNYHRYSSGTLSALRDLVAR